jgi:hypothetical protein
MYGILKASMKRGYIPLFLLANTTLPSVFAALFFPVGDFFTSIGDRGLGVAAGAIKNGPASLLRGCIFSSSRRSAVLYLLTTPFLGERADFGRVVLSQLLLV